MCSLLCQHPCYAIDGIPETPRAFLATFLWVTMTLPPRLGSFLPLLELGLWSYVWVVAESVRPPALLCHTTRASSPACFKWQGPRPVLPLSCPLATAGFVCPLLPPVSCMVDQLSFGVGIRGTEEKKKLKDSCMEKLGSGEPCELVERHQQLQDSPCLLYTAEQEDWSIGMKRTWVS